MAKPLHIVPMWNTKKQAYEDTIWPSINYYDIVAHRSGVFAGKDPVEFGPDKEFNFNGRKLTAPEWAIATVYRLVNGERCAFKSDQIFFCEYVQLKKGQQNFGQPNEMWSSKPRTMLAKCATAAALRLAFPEVGSDPTAEEMDGSEVVTVEASPSKETLMNDPGTQAIANAGKRTRTTKKEVAPEAAEGLNSASEQPEDVVDAEALPGDTTAEAESDSVDPTQPSTANTVDPDAPVTTEDINAGIARVKANGWNSRNLTPISQKLFNKGLPSLTVAQLETILEHAEANKAPGVTNG